MFCISMILGKGVAMKETLKNVIVGLLTGVYQSFWFVLLFAVVFMFAYKHHSGIKDAVQKWLLWFKTEKKFRRVFFLTLYTAFILFRTLFSVCFFLHKSLEMLINRTISVQNMV